jgi:hypothetical protein
MDFSRKSLALVSHQQDRVSVGDLEPNERKALSKTEPSSLVGLEGSFMSYKSVEQELRL